MNCTIYDTSSNEAVARGKPWPTADGSVPADLDANLVLLEEIVEDDPAYDSDTHELSESWVDDLQAKTTTLQKTVVELPLATAKANRCASIDARTRELIEAGFTYDGHTFSLSQQAQMNLDGVQMAAGKSMITFPHKMSTTDDSVEYELADQAALDAIYGQAVGTIKAHMDSGRVLKKMIAACSTVAEVAAIVDTR